MSGRVVNNAGRGLFPAKRRRSLKIRHSSRGGGECITNDAGCPAISPNCREGTAESLPAAAGRSLTIPALQKKANGSVVYIEPSFSGSHAVRRGVFSLVAGRVYRPLSFGREESPDSAGQDVPWLTRELRCDIAGDGKCHRKQTSSKEGRVKRWGKSPPLQG